MNMPVDQLVDGFVRFRVDLSYDGTDFAGWARQPGMRTVHGEVVRVLTQLFGDSDTDFDLRVAGRTDAGVHAEHQVIHVDLNERQIKRIGRNKDVAGRLNKLLDPDVRVRSFEKAPEHFHARYGATYRRYRYRVADATATQNAMHGRFTLWLSYELNVLEMQATALEFYGLHDFASFCKPRDIGTTIRDIKEITVKRNKHDNNVIEIEVMADAFCHNMIRSIVGALIKVGGGRATKAEVVAALGAKNRAHPYKVVEPHGLSMIEIGYPPVKKLAEHVALVQRTRTLDEN